MAIVRLLLALVAVTASAQMTYHDLEVIPDQSGTAGELRFVETTGWTSGTGVNYVGFKPPASIGSNVVWTLPATDSTGAQCLSSNGSGTLSWVACSGGGASLPVVDTTSIVEGSVDDTKEIRFEVDGLTTGTVRVLTPQNADYTLAGTNIAQTFSATQTFQNVSFASDNTYTLGGVTARPADIYGYDVLLGRSGVAAGTLQILNTSGIGYTIGVQASGYMTLSNNFYPSTSSSYNIGSASDRWDNIYSNTFHVGANGGSTGTLNFQHASTSGTAALRAANVTGGVDIETARPFYSAFNGVHDLGLATREWANVYASVYRASGSYRGPSGVAGTSTTLSCPATQAVTSITVSGGIVTAVSCSVP